MKNIVLIRLSSNELKHYGVLGMKWGIRNEETLDRYARGVKVPNHALGIVSESASFSRLKIPMSPNEDSESIVSVLMDQYEVMSDRDKLVTGTILEATQKMNDLYYTEADSRPKAEVDGLDGALGFKSRVNNPDNRPDTPTNIYHFQPLDKDPTEYLGSRMSWWNSDKDTSDKFAALRGIPVDGFRRIEVKTEADDRVVSTFNEQHDIVMSTYNAIVGDEPPNIKTLGLGSFAEFMSEEDRPLFAKQVKAEVAIQKRMVERGMKDLTPEQVEYLAISRALPMTPVGGKGMALYSAEKYPHIGYLVDDYDNNIGYTKSALIRIPEAAYRRASESQFLDRINTNLYAQGKQIEVKPSAAVRELLTTYDPDFDLGAYEISKLVKKMSGGG